MSKIKQSTLLILLVVLAVIAIVTTVVLKKHFSQLRTLAPRCSYPMDYSLFKLVLIS